MRATKCTKDDLQKALDIINQKYDDNIKFNPDSDLPKRFTLRVHGKGPGSAYSPSYVQGFNWAKKRRTGSVCWHAHGDFFDALFSINPVAVVYSRGDKITIKEGNWLDFNCGSEYKPAFASDCCECEGEL